MQQSLSWLNQCIIYTAAFKECLTRLTHFIRYDLFSTPLYVFMKGSYTPVKISDLLPLTTRSIEWYYDSQKNCFYQPNYEDLKYERSTILSAELIGDTIQEDLTPFFENSMWSGYQEPTELHYASAWAISKGKYIPFDGTYNLRFVNIDCNEITRNMVGT